ncbi:hypothetical protein T484DRAFT_3389795 [Baffinella frigidus]|nr:hypothetical protein T484DRAFT_3389795 [Cryptophyta sp. CCMP2293]
MAGGVGIYLARKVNGEYMVTLVTPNGPAALSGAVLPGDILLEVDGWPVENMDPQQVHESIVGHPGNICTLLLSSFANDGFNKGRWSASRGARATTFFAAPRTTPTAPASSTPTASTPRRTTPRMWTPRMLTPQAPRGSSADC